MTTPMDSKDHWQAVYRTTALTDVSWYEPVPKASLALIGAAGIGPEAPILDVGGGASTLVDHLLGVGFKDITVLDIAAAALGAAQARLGPQAAKVTWIEGEILSFRPARRYLLWYDRAVLHFLTEPADKERYLITLEAALQPFGYVILAAFGPDGPTSCSGLPVLRYSADRLGVLLGPGFVLRRSSLELHVTPAGRTQQFICGIWQAQN